MRLPLVISALFALALGCFAFNAEAQFGGMMWQPSGAGPPPSALTFDPSNALKAMTLSGGNLVATTTGTLIDSTRSTTSQSSGKWCVKFTATTVHTSQPYFWVVSLQGGSYNPATADNIQGYETGSNSLAINRLGNLVFHGGIGSESFVGPLVSADSVEIDVDITNKLFWYKRNVEGYNNGIPGTPDPATGVGGYNLVSDFPMPAVPWYFGFASATDSGNVATIVSGCSTAGFSSWAP